jgi:hypothetical protein
MMASERDPHDVAPSGFFDQFPGGIEQAAYELDTTTDRGDMSRCPECASTAIFPKPHSAIADDVYFRKPGDWRCKSCDCHFDERAPAANDEDVPEHDGCGRRVWVRPRPGEKNYYCHRCGESFDD